MLESLAIVEFSKLLGHIYDGHIEEDPYSSFLQNVRETLSLNFASMTLREPIGDDGG